MQSENRGLQELALYVNAITRSGGGQGKSAGTAGGDGLPQGVLPPASDLGSSAPASRRGAASAGAPTPRAPGKKPPGRAAASVFRVPPSAERSSSCSALESSHMNWRQWPHGSATKRDGSI